MNSTYAPLALIAVVLAMAIYGATRDREPALATEAGQGMAGTGTSEVQVPVRTYATPMPPVDGSAAASGDTAAEQPDNAAPGQSAGGLPQTAAPRTDTGASEQTAASGGADTGTESAAGGTQATAEAPQPTAETTPADGGPIEQAWDAVKEGVEEGVEEVQEVTRQGLEATKEGLEKAGAATVDLFSGEEEKPKGQ